MKKTTKNDEEKKMKMNDEKIKKCGKNIKM